MPTYRISSGLPDLPSGLPDKDYNLVAPLFRAIHSVAKQSAAASNFVQYSATELGYVNQVTPLLLERTNRVFVRAGEPLMYGNLVYLAEIDSRYVAYKADWNASTGARAVGCVSSQDGIAEGANGEIVFMSGICPGVLDTLLGVQYYLGPDGTAIDTPVAGNLIQPVGIGLGSAGLYLSISSVYNSTEFGYLGDATYVHDQAVPDTLWTIIHPLRKFPSVSVVSSSNEEVEGEVSYISDSELTVSFAAAFSGSAYLN